MASQIPRDDVEDLKRLFELMHGSQVRNCFDSDKEFTKNDKIRATVWEMAINDIEELLDPDAENPGLTEEALQESDSDEVEKSRRWRNDG